MKKHLLFMLLALIIGATSCEEDDDLNNPACDRLPHNAAPAGLSGGWANGFTSFTQLIDVYNGKFLGTTWQSGKYFRFTNNGKGAEFYYTAQSQFSKVATKATGTIEFDEGATATRGSFVFHACSGHYRGWGSTNVDRAATEQELKNNLSGRYYYVMEGDWLRIEPNAEPHAFTSSFKKVN